MLKRAEYIWLDGAKPRQMMRSKTKILDLPDDFSSVTLDHFPEWGFDGSSTGQADGHDSDRAIRPVRFCYDPLRDDGSALVLCAVFYPDAHAKEGLPHETNHRAELRRVLDAGAAAHKPWFGVEQEYTLFRNSRPLGWPDSGYPAPQGPFYCGVGADEAFGRDIIEAHTEACLQAGIMIFGTNAEVMPGQWEFQIGYRGVDTESADALTVSDHLWLARWLLFRIGEIFDVSATLDQKPMKGDWNGAGQHTNFSSTEMRDPKTGRAEIERVCKALGEKHAEHIAVYGPGIEQRLTGLHETCDYRTFRYGVSDRGASIRIPATTNKNGHGYIEDRRPGANANPDLVFARILKTIYAIE
jgi:glutamine synthetase